MSKGRILIVDDNPMNVDILRRILRKEFELESATNGQECLDLIPEFRPQLVLLDIMMPGLNGYEVCERIKAGSVCDLIQVILVSGKGSPEERVKGYECKADDYVVKPFNHEEMLSKVHVHFRLLDAQRQLSAANDRLELYTNELERLVSLRTRQLTATQDMAVFALAQLTDSRDPGTGHHLMRMRAYSQTLAEELAEHGPYVDQVDQAFLENLYRASPLHDIGKVGIPDAILQKPGRLTVQELERMKQHVVIGAETLERSLGKVEGSDFLIMAAEIARYHHERFNGAGYIEGLSGQDIPLSARIVAVADVYDALTSRRVYKPAYDVQNARSTILAESRAHFDPAIVEAFDRRFEDFLQIGTRLADGVDLTLDPFVRAGSPTMGKDPVTEPALPLDPVTAV